MTGRRFCYQKSQSGEFDHIAGVDFDTESFTDFCNIEKLDEFIFNQ